MPDDRDVSQRAEATLAVPGLLCVSPFAQDKSAIAVGPAAGWMVPRGISDWEREISFVERPVMTAALARALRATLPEEQIAPKRFPTVKRAVESSPLVAVGNHLVQDIRKQGIRVHTVGVDRVSGDFYYFEEGGPREPVHVQGNLVEMLAPALEASSTNADIAELLVGFVDRLLLALSDGAVSELAVELVDALPRVARDGTGLDGTDLDAFEAQASTLANRSARWDAAARRIPEALAAAARRGQRSAIVPLFGEAKQFTRPALQVLVAGKPLRLPAQILWTVTGPPSDQIKEAPSPRVAAGAPATPPAGAKKPGAPFDGKPAGVKPTPAPQPALAPVSPPVPVRSSSPAPVAAPAAVALARPVAGPAAAPLEPAPSASPAPVPVPAQPVAPASSAAPAPVSVPAALVVTSPASSQPPAPSTISSMRPPMRRSSLPRIVALLLLAVVAYFALRRMH
jgi:hypothetical protein